MKAVSTLLCILLSLSIFSVRVECLCPDKISNLVRWSQWQDAPTNAGARVNIGVSTAVLLDVSPPVIEHIDVYGTLVFDPAVPAINLTVGSVYVRKGGKMYLGSSECPMSNSVTINIKGSPKPDVDPDGLGTKVLGVFEGGLLEIHGKPRQPVWTVLSSTASINSTRISLAENVDWAIGEKIVIATTDFEIFNDELGAPVTQNEEVTITARPSNNEVEFTPGLKYLHYGNIWTAENGDKIDMRAEVGLINRNILIQGDLSSELSGDSLAKEWGGHVMIRDGGVARIEYMEITKVGQRGEFGRYPLHFHNASTQPDSYLRGNSIHNTFQRCIVVHSTFNLRIQNNFAYRGKGHCYFIEDGNEEQNVFDHNLGIRPLVLSGALLDSDLEPAVFWTTNPLNHFYRNVAVGGKMGFWFAMPVSPLALSAAQTDNRLRHKINGDFVGNKAHSGNVGLFIDRGQMNAKPGSVTQQTDYFPTNLTAAVALSEQLGKPIDLKGLGSYELMSYGSRVPAHFVDFTAYKSREEGMWGRGSYMHSYGARLADNIVGCIWPGFANLMQDTVIVGETDNIGTFNNLPMYQWWGDEEGRTRPVKSFLHSPILGYSSYDASGGDLAIDIRFHNFNDFTFTKGTNAGKVRKSGALTGLTGPNVIEPGNRIYRAKFYNVKNRVYYREYLPWRPNLATVDDAVKGIVWVDADGSILAGLPEAGCGKTIVGSGPHVRTAGCVQKSDWNAWICNANTNAHRPFYITQSSTTNTVLNATEIRTAFDVHLTKLSDSATVDIEPNLRSSGSSYTASLSYGTNIVVNNNYYLSLGNKNTFLSAFAISVHDMDVKEKVRFAVPFSGSNTPVVKYGYQGANPATEVSSYDDLVMNSYYFNKAENLLWVQLGVSSVDYDYHYDLPFVDSYAEMSVSSDCSANADKLCSYPARGTPSNPGNIPAVAVNLCETSGAITGGVTSYTVKTSDTYVLFDDKYADGWEKNSRCNISSELTYEGTSALRCIYPRYEYSSIYRVWDQTPLDTSKFTHIQLAARSAPGHGNAELSLNMFNKSWTHFSAASVQSPFYTHNAGPITDDKWSLVTIPIADFKLPKSDGIWGISLSLSAARPMQFYVDSIKFVSLNSQKTAIANYPPAPAKVSLVGPGPSDSYGTDPPVDDNSSATTGASTGTTTAAGDNLDSGASRSLCALFSVVVFVILTLL